MTTTGPDQTEGQSRIILITGPSGAGRSTAINALEDLGQEAVDNMPLSLLPRLLDGPPLTRPLALGFGVGNRDFATDGVIELIGALSARPDIALSVVFIDCDEDELLRRYSATRRRHPLADDDGPVEALRRERELLVPVRARADVLIDSTGMSPHDLSREIERWFAPGGARPMTVTLQSFSYKRGLPRGLDIVLDCRFLRNPHWDPGLRARDGRDQAVQDHVMADPRFDAFLARIRDLVGLLLPACRDEGKAHLAIGFGCTGGQHRSVTVVETLARALADEGWPVSKRHRELERREGVAERGPDG